MDEFLVEQNDRLKPGTFSKYRSVVELFQHCMNGYASQWLDEEEQVFYDMLCDDMGSQYPEFCDVFGPEKIPQNVSEFLNYFMPRKVACGKELLRAAGTVTKKLGKWLVDRGYVEPEDGAGMSDKGARASKDLPDAERLEEMLVDYVSAYDDDAVEYVDGRFIVRMIGPESLAMEEMLDGSEAVVPVPRRAAELCRPGWTISGCIGQFADGWRLVEIWNVYS